MPFVFALLVALLVGFVVGALTFLPRRKEGEDTPPPSTAPTVPTAPLALPYNPTQPLPETLPSSPDQPGSGPATTPPPPTPDASPSIPPDQPQDIHGQALSEAREIIDELLRQLSFRSAEDCPELDKVNAILAEEGEKARHGTPTAKEAPRSGAEAGPTPDASLILEVDDPPPEPIPAIEQTAAELGDLLDRYMSHFDEKDSDHFFATAKSLAEDQTISTLDLLRQVGSGRHRIIGLSLATLALRADPAVFDHMDLVTRLLRSPSDEIRKGTLGMLSCSAGSAPCARQVLLAYADQPLPEQVLRQSIWLRRRLHAEGDGFIPFTAEDLIADAPLGPNLAMLLEGLPKELADKAAPDRRIQPLSDTNKSDLAEIGALHPPHEGAGPPEGSPAHLIRHELVDHAIKTSFPYLTRPQPRPVLLVGEPGMGNSTTISLLSHDLGRLGYAIFEASSTELLAGQSYIGEIEGRARKLVEILSHRRVVWVIDRFHEFVSAGTTKQSQTSLLDLMLPPLRSGELRAIAKTSAAGLQALTSAHPRLATIFKIVRLRSPRHDHVTPIVRRWAANFPGTALARPVFPDAVIEEAHQLVTHFFPSRHAPGNVIELLQLTWEQLLEPPSPEEETTSPSSQAGLLRTVAVTEEALLSTLANTTGMPLELLDPRAKLDVPALEAHFARHILGQPEAVRVLIDRVIMLKAGLTDPSRPLGVFLFAGPTGTGKTQIAKTLTSYLFGSPDRMIRLDMSEFIHPDSLARLLGHDGRPHAGPALIDHIQRQPFSLILLDEFEKAAPNIWDLFLQVFDEGRLTSWTGEVVDFRNTIIILTSNLGAAAARQAGLGFSSTPQDSDAFRPESIHQSISLTFRPEFLNRLDRVVVFRPLDRPIMRKILVHDLDAILRRRGLRNRGWHFEWDESAIDFLLDRGFTRDLGARPLRRAIDEHVLTRLSAAIVAGQAPADATTVRVAADPSGESLTVDFLASPPLLPQAPTPPPQPEPELRASGQT